jgi:hypothetical protein
MTATALRRCACGLVVAPLLAFVAASSAASPTPRQTIAALRFDYTDAQLNQIYRGLPAGRMPGNATSRGFVRFVLGAPSNPFSPNRQLNTTLNDPLTPLFWKGQVWFNDEGEQELMNRVLNDSTKQLPAYVKYGKSLVDGRRAMIATYPGATNPPPVNNIVLECRTVQAGVLFCYAWQFVIQPLVGPKVQLFYVFQDFTNPN